MLRFLLFFLTALLFFYSGCFAQQPSDSSTLEFDHLYVVVPDEVYNKIVSNHFVLSQFANVDKGRGDFLPIDTAKKEAYFRFEDSYFELLSDKNKWGEPVNKIGIGWVTIKPEAAKQIYETLKNEFGARAEIVENKNSEGKRDHSVIYAKSLDTSKNEALSYWIYDYDPAYINRVYKMDSSRANVDVTGKKDRLPYYATDKLAKSITELSLTLTSEGLAEYLKWLRFLNYTVDKQEDVYVVENDEIRFILNEGIETSLKCLKLRLNRISSSQKIIFSENIYIEFQGEECTWWFN